MTGEAGRPPQGMDAPLPASKLLPVTAGIRRVPQRLMEALHPRPACLTLVHAGAGYGKTTALAATFEPGSTWYNLDATDADADAFALRLCRAMELPPPAPGASTVEALAMELARRLQGPPTTLTLDRWERIGQAAGPSRFLDGLLQLAPALALRVATRTRPSLPLERMRLEGRLIDLGPGDLRLQRAEIADLLTAFWQRPPCPAELDLADTLLAGWPAAIQLWLAGLDSPRLLGPLLRGSLLHEYFEEQVLGTLPEDVRDLVLRDWRWLSGAGALVERATNSHRRDLANRLVRDRVAVVPGPGGWEAHPLLVAYARMLGPRSSEAAALGTLAAAARGAETAPDADRRLTIRTFGGLSMLVDGDPLPDAAWPASSRRLLELLLSQRGRETTADDAARLLWPSHPISSALNSFNVALHGLRRAMEPGLTSGARSRFVVREGRRYRLRLEHVLCDAEEFVRLVHDVPSPIDEAGAQRLQAAMDLHRGDFLASCGEQFAAERRAELRELLLSSAAKLGQWRSGRDRGDLATVG